MSQMSGQKKLDGILPDSCLDRIYVDLTGEPKAVYYSGTKATKSIVMNFVGRVSIEPVEGSIHVATVFGHKVFVHPTGFPD